MTDNVVTLPGKKEPAMHYACECGCVTLYVLTDGTLECPVCGNTTMVDVKPERVANFTPPNIKYSIDLTDVFSAKNRMQRRMAEDKTVYAMLLQDDDMSSWWANTTKVDQMEWMINRVNDVLEEMHEHRNQLADEADKED